jgi:hypothetical protein
MAFPPGYADGRQFRRYDFRILAIATIHPPKGREDDRIQVCYVLTRDISRGGICFMHPTPLFQSQRIDLELPDGRKFTLAIRRVSRVEHGRYLIGCRFADIVDPNPRGN